MKEETTTVDQLKSDDINANKGTSRGNAMLADSLKKFRAGRSILLDKNNKIIAGNKTAEQAAAAGITKVRIIDSDGTKLIAVKRTDLSMDEPEGQALALYDNRVAQVNLEWDSDAFMKLREQNVKFENSFLDHELEKILSRASTPEMSPSVAPDAPKAPEKLDPNITSKTSLEQLFFDVETFLKFEEVMTRLEGFFETEGNLDTIMAALEYVNANTTQN